jgi:hypothetical protein
VVNCNPNCNPDRQRDKVIAEQDDRARIAAADA